MKLFIYLFTALLICYSSPAQESIISKDIEFFREKTKFSGTITAKDTLKKHPAIVMITGSGPQNRDEEIMGFKIFKIIAEYLSENGYVVLRYDDRGVGKSKGKTDTATTYTFALDALEAVNYLRQQSYVNSEKIGIFGHSEGGVAAIMLASQFPKLIDFIVLMASSTVQGSEVINSQIAAISKIAGKTDTEINDVIAFQNTLYELLNRNADLDEIKTLIKEYTIKAINALPEEQKKYITDIEQYADGQATMQSMQVNSNWFKYFIKFNPVKDIENLQCSVISLFGGKDMQVITEINKKSLDESIKKSKAKYYSCEVFPEANHLFQAAGTGSPDEYYGLKKEFVPGFLEHILKELKKIK